MAHLKVIWKSNPKKLKYGLRPLMAKLLFFLCTIYCFGKLFQNCPLVFHVSSHRAIFFLNGGETSYISSHFLCTFSLSSSLSSPHVGNTVADLSPSTGGYSTANTTFPSNKLLNGRRKGQRKRDQATLQNAVVWTIIAPFALYLADQTLRQSSGASFSESLTLRSISISDQ